MATDEIDSALANRDQAIAQRDQAIRDRDEAMAERDFVLKFFTDIGVAFGKSRGLAFAATAEGVEIRALYASQADAEAVANCHRNTEHDARKSDEIRRTEHYREKNRLSLVRRRFESDCLSSRLPSRAP
jgi:hypothetical protein